MSTPRSDATRAPGAPLATSTHEVALLDFRASVEAPAEIIQRLRASVPAPAAWAARPTASSTRFVVSRDVPSAGWHTISRDSATIFQTNRPWDLVPYLVWAINWEAVERLTGRYLLLHAGAVAWNGRVVICSADSGSGKTTLVAGLLAAGFEYLSDDIVPLDLESGLLLPFAKSLSLKPGGKRPLHRVYRAYGRPLPPVRGHPECGWALVPSAPWPAQPLPARYIILPRYVRGGQTRLERISRGAAAERVLSQTFNLGAHGVTGASRIVGMVQGAECYALTVGKLEAAVAMVRQLVSGASADPHA